MTIPQIIWSLLPWWGWLGIVLSLLSILVGTVWCWLCWRRPEFSGRGFRLVLTLAIIGGTLTATGLQQETETLRLLPCSSISTPRYRGRLGVLELLWLKYQLHKHQ